MSFDSWDDKTEFDHKARCNNHDSLQYFSLGTIIDNFKEALKIYDRIQLKDYKNIINLMILKEFFVVDVSCLIIEYYILLFDKHIISFNPSCGPLEKLLELQCKVSIKCITHYVKSLTANVNVNKYFASKYIKNKKINNLMYLDAGGLLNTYPSSKNNNIMLLNCTHSYEYYFKTISILYFNIVKKLQPSCILLIGNSLQLHIEKDSNTFSFINVNNTHETIVYNVDKISTTSDGCIGLAGINMLIILSK